MACDSSSSSDHDEVCEVNPLLLDDLLPHGDGRRLPEGLQGDGREGEEESQEERGEEVE